MNKRFSTKTASLLACFACFVVYIFLCLTRNTYPAAMESMIADGVFSKSDAGLVTASFYFFYGITQILGGWFADRVSPFLLILLGLVGSIASCAVMAFANTLPVMVIVWGMYGLSSFAVWPAIVKILSSMLMEKHRSMAILIIPFGVNIGTMLSYLAAALALNAGSWRDLFHVSYILLAVVTVPFMLLTLYFRRRLTADDTQTEVKQRKTEKGGVSLFRLITVSGLLLLLIPSLIRSMLDTGLKTWVPTMITENYGVTSTFAVSLTTVLLVVNLLAIFLVAWMYPRRCRNAAMAVGIYFAATVPLTAVLIFTGRIPLAIVLVMLALVTTLMSAAAQFFNASFAAAYAPYGKNGVIAGVMNTASCLGCVIANYGYGIVAEKFGWTVTVIVWVVLALIALVCCLLAVPKWAKFMKGKIQ